MKLFETTDLTAGWEIESSSDWKVNDWFFNVLALETQGKVYVSIASLVEGATYDQNGTSTVRLASNLINAKGFTDVTVSFDYVAGGERDNLESSTIFDYGAFVYSFDGINFTTLEKFVVIITEGPWVKGTYDGALPELDNAKLYLC
jgi:hypothetical protein